MGLFSSKKQTVGYKYKLGVHAILCHGPIDRLLALLFDRKSAWEGISTGGRIEVDAEDLFGGKSREGGVSGDVDFEQGGPTQVANDYLSSLLEDVPGFRGVAGLIFRRFYFGMNPYLKRWAAVAQRIHVRQDGIEQWYDEKAAITNEALVVEPTASFEEDFADLDGYNMTDARGLFTVADNTLSIATESFGLDSQIITSEGVNGIENVTRVVFRVRITDEFAEDDGGLFALSGFLTLAESSPSATLTFNPRRELTFDSGRRALIQFGADSIFFDTSLTVGAWYEVEWVYVPETGAWSATLSDADGDVIDSVENAAEAGAGPGPYTTSSMRFWTNAAAGSIFTVPTEYQDIRIFGSGTSEGADMNPAHIIRECLTDPDWGMGYSEADMDDAAFTYAADTLYDEGLGLSLLWDKQIPIEDFVKEILKHIDGALYVSPSTGKFVLKLIRDDYVFDDLVRLDESNVDRVENFTRRGYDELVNSVTVAYHDATNWKDASVEVQDIAAIQMQGAVINSALQYPGVTNSALAGRIAARDLRALSAPLFSCTIYANLDARGLQIGDAFRFSWAEYDLVDAVARVTGVVLGDGDKNLIRLQVGQDVFAMPATTYVTVDPTGWEDPSGPPLPVDAQLAGELPYYELVRQFEKTTVDAELGASPTRGVVFAAAKRSTGAINAVLATNSGAGYEEVGEDMDFSATATTVGAMGLADVSVELENAVALDGVEAGTFCQIDDELCVVDSIVGTTLSLGRGALDTVPATHEEGARVWFWQETRAVDPTDYVASNVVNVKVLPVTAQGQLSLGAATATPVTLASRAVRPYPPGQVKINGAYYPTAPIEGTLTVTWAHRNRLLQLPGNALLDFLDAGVTPETGTRYYLQLLADDAATILDSVSAVAGTSATLDVPGDAGLGYVRLKSRRGGYDSWQSHLIPVEFVGGTALLTETEGAILCENGEGLLTEETAPVLLGEFTMTLEQEASGVSAGNRQVVFFAWGGVDGPGDSAGFEEALPENFLLSAERGEGWAVPKVYQLEGRYNVSVELSSLRERVNEETRGALFADAIAAGADIATFSRDTTSGPYPSDWCQNFDEVADGWDYAVVFPTGEPVYVPMYVDSTVGRVVVTPPGTNGASPARYDEGEWTFYGTCLVNYPWPSGLRLYALVGDGFEPAVPAPRGRTVSFNVGTITSVVEGATYRITLGGVNFDYVAAPGDDFAELVVGLEALIDAHADYSCPTSSSPDRWSNIQVTGPDEVEYTYSSTILPP